MQTVCVSNLVTPYYDCYLCVVCCSHYYATSPMHLLMMVFVWQQAASMSHSSSEKLSQSTCKFRLLEAALSEAIVNFVS